jgi:hypothetical protein
MSCVYYCEQFSLYLCSLTSPELALQAVKLINVN